MRVYVKGGAGADQLVGANHDLAVDRASDGDVLTNVEVVFGSRHADHPLGDEDPDGLWGGAAWAQARLDRGGQAGRRP